MSSQDDRLGELLRAHFERERRGHEPVLLSADAIDRIVERAQTQHPEHSRRARLLVRLAGLAACFALGLGLGAAGGGSQLGDSPSDDARRIGPSWADSQPWTSTELLRAPSLDGPTTDEEMVAIVEGRDEAAGEVKPEMEMEESWDTESR